MIQYIDDYFDDRKLQTVIDPICMITGVQIVPKFRDGLTGLSVAEERHKKILGQLLYTASRLARMEEKLRDGYRIVINEGGYGGQTVLHLHLHLLGGRFMQWPPG